MKKLLLAVLMLTLSLSFVSCTNDEEDTTIIEEVVADEDSNTTYNYDSDIKSLDNGDYVLTLAGNPTTGYQWTFEEEYKGDLVKLSELEYLSSNEGKAPEEMLMGAGGVYKLTLTPNKDSKETEAVIKLRYARSWESNNGIAHCTVTVTNEDGNIKVDYIKE